MFDMLLTEILLFIVILLLFLLLFMNATRVTFDIIAFLFYFQINVDA